MIVIHDRLNILHDKNEKTGQISKVIKQVDEKNGSIIYKRWNYMDSEYYREPTKEELKKFQCFYFKEDGTQPLKKKKCSECADKKACKYFKEGD